MKTVTRYFVTLHFIVEVFGHPQAINFGGSTSGGTSSGSESKGNINIAVSAVMQSVII